MSELIKLKVLQKASTGNSAEEITNKFIEACLNLDTSIFEPLISEDHYFDDINKYQFLASLKEQFDGTRERGAKNLKMVRGKCEMCVLGHPTYEFHDPNKGIMFAYIINTKGDEIQDIFLCNLSTGYGMSL